MLDGVVAEAWRWLEGLRRLNRRGLLLLRSCGSPSALLAPVLAGRVLVVASRGRRGEWEWLGWRLASPARVQRLLGGEYDAVVVDVEPPLLPNLLAAVAEMVRSPGVLVVVEGRWPEWDPGGHMGTGGYARYLAAVLERLESLLVLDCGLGVVSERLPGTRGEEPWPPGPPDPHSVSRDYLLVPRALRALVATRDQAEVLAAVYRFSRGGYRSLLVTGDRGRGKSAALGLGIALLAARRSVGVVTVTAPSPESVQSLFAMLVKGLEAMRVEYSVVERSGLVVGVRGHWFHVRYHTPAELYEPGALLVVDEAAAVGPHRLRMLARKSRRVMAATTIHGYEGSGRVLAHMVERLLPQPMLRVELVTPVRYPPGDPLEEWLYEAFALRRGAEWPREARSARCVVFDGWRLGGDPWLARSIYEVLAEAHYRNEPDDLALMLDAPHYRIYALMDGSVPVAVAEVSLEWLLEPERRMLWSLLGRPEARTARIVRIAVAPPLQRRGLGTRLLRCVEASMPQGVVLGAVYSRHDVTPFWLRRGYRVVYVSPRFNRATGEKNIAVAKPVTAPYSVVAEAERRARARLVYAGQSVYRDLPAEVLAEILSVEPLLATRPPVGLEEWQLREAAEFIEGRVDHEAAWASIWPLIASRLVSRGLAARGRSGVALVARLVQGKPLSEVAAILGVSREEAARLVDEAARLEASLALRESA